jgi:hypothetical protein
MYALVYPSPFWLEVTKAHLFLTLNHPFPLRMFGKFGGMGRPGWLLGPCWLRCGWQHRGLCSPPLVGDQALPHRPACGYGLHHPEFTGKLPGYLSPSAGRLFADGPHGDHRHDLPGRPRAWVRSWSTWPSARPCRTSPRARRLPRWLQEADLLGPAAITELYESTRALRAARGA